MSQNLQIYHQGLKPKVLKFVCNRNFFLYKLASGSLFAEPNTMVFDTIKDYKVFISSFNKHLQILRNGFFYTLILKGIGFYFFKLRNILIVDIGFSNFLGFNIPSNLIIQRFKSKITVFGFSLDCINQFVTMLRNIKKNNAYKGKGLYFSDEFIKLKIINKKTK